MFSARTGKGLAALIAALTLTAAAPAFAGDHDRGRGGGRGGDRGGWSHKDRDHGRDRGRDHRGDWNNRGRDHHNKRVVVVTPVRCAPPARCEPLPRCEPCPPPRCEPARVAVRVKVPRLVIKIGGC